METEETHVQPADGPQFILTSEAQYYLHKAGQWAFFLGIVGFIGTGLILLMALFMGTMFSVMSKFQPQTATPYSAGAIGGAMSFIYVLIAVFYFFFSLYLYQFGDRIQKGITHTDGAETTIALGKLKSLFKLAGISTIVIISLYILMFIFMIIAGMAGLMGK